MHADVTCLRFVFQYGLPLWNAANATALCVRETIVYPTTSILLGRHSSDLIDVMIRQIRSNSEHRIPFFRRLYYSL